MKFYYLSADTHGFLLEKFVKLSPQLTMFGFKPRLNKYVVGTVDVAVESVLDADKDATLMTDREVQYATNVPQDLRPVKLTEEYFNASGTLVKTTADIKTDLGITDIKP